MKRLILKLLLLLVPVVSLFFAANALYERTNYWKSKDYANKYTDAPYGIELGCFGSSIPCYAFKFDVVPEIKAWNFANVTEMFDWSYRVLKNYINHFAKGSVIIIDLPCGAFDRNLTTTFRERYYRVLPKVDMDKWVFTEWLAYSKFPFLTAGKDKMRIFKDISKEEMSPFYDRNESMTETELNDFAENAYQAIQKNNEDAAKNNFDTISAFMDLCYSYGVVPVLVSCPVSISVIKTYARDPTFFDRFEGFTKQLQDKYPDLVFLDYSRDEDFIYNHEYFKDAMHMCNAGAEKFTLKFVGDLRARGILK